MENEATNDLDGKRRLIHSDEVQRKIKSKGRYDSNYDFVFNLFRVAAFYGVPVTGNQTFNITEFPPF